MLRLLPYDRFVLASALPVDALVRRLDAVTEPPRFTIFGRDGPRFFGEADASGFRIVANIRGRNSYLPTVTGNFRPASEGTLIDVTLELPSIVRVVLIGYSVFALAGFALSIVIALTDDPLNGAISAVCSLLLLGLLWAFTGLFWLEARRVERDLENVLETRRAT